MDDKKQTVRAVERALDILICFTDKQELGLTEIAKLVDLNKSTVHRLLASLEGKGFLIRDPITEKYRLGFRLWELSAHLVREDDPALLFLPEMEKLRDLLGETISLYVRDGRERIRIQAVESKHTIRRVAPIGVRLPLAVGASSKVLVAFSDESVMEFILQDPAWPETIDKENYVEQLKRIEQTGYATSVEEREQGTSAVAAPVFNRMGDVVAALSVSGPAARLTIEKMVEMAPAVMVAAQRMGKMVKK
ncbi:IclR family transcriptional regulator [Ammoniphilus sp. CFH 90114]|uniref:IclR family transcriptional regulator n=1 Tax=Ammoniphilus sp. CFH 90114 TaxID=2493665 RepID=UPI00100DC845|nr:IclR family transcriptional regulator [Ammoniphilus sp. CFH 90114]RXT05669.1 IclR family transcriptional regulator [Ammoniphilus sp. CFH 90114]